MHDFNKVENKVGVMHMHFVKAKTKSEASEIDSPAYLICQRGVWSNI
jgi:hypothetical protein